MIRIALREAAWSAWVSALPLLFFILLQALAIEKDEKRRHASLKAAVKSVLGKE